MRKRLKTQRLTAQSVERLAEASLPSLLSPNAPPEKLFHFKWRRSYTADDPGRDIRASASMRFVARRCLLSEADNLWPGHVK